MVERERTEPGTQGSQQPREKANYTKDEKGETTMAKEFFVITVIDGEQSVHTMSVRELAELWEQDNISGGYIDEIIAYRFNLNTHEMEKVNVYETAQEFLKGQREIEQEYRDYCETVNEYGYDYYDNPDNLEMGFDPYMGTYSDDC